IIIGKITPKGETDPTPEEKLLRAIFGDKAGDVKDASMKASPSLNGVVIDTKLFSRPKKDKDLRAKSKEDVVKLKAQYSRDLLGVRAKMIRKLVTIMDGKTSNGVKHNLVMRSSARASSSTRKTSSRTCSLPRTPIGMKAIIMYRRRQI